MMFRWLLAMAVFAPAALAAPLPLVVPKDAPAPARPVHHAARAVLDCGGATTLVVTPDLSEALSGDTTGGVSQADGYACVGWQETGPEAIWLLDVQEDTALHAAVDADVDLDIFLLTACDSDSCAAWHASEFLTVLPARAEPYVLVVDGYLGAEGPFELSLTGYGAGPGAEVCATAELVTCDTPPTTTGGNLFERPNRLLGDACATYLQFGGEQWFAVSLSDSAVLDVDTSEHYFDAALWLYDACDAEAVCVAFADAASAEGAESLTYQNLTGARRTYYLAVDAFRAVESEAGGAFTLQFGCTGQLVANQRKSLSDIKAMFR